MSADVSYFLSLYKQAATAIGQAVAESAHSISSSFPTEDPLRAATIRFTTQGGKRFRPALSYITAKTLGNDTVNPHAALETFHKFILTHDDVIDRDAIRYNAPTTHAELEALCNARANAEREHFGNSLAIVSGDLLHAATTKIILASELPDATKLTLLDLVAQAVDEVVWGWYDQFLMDYLPLDSPELSFERIEKSIIWVTGKYSIKLPLLFGYAVANKPAPDDLEQLADIMGALFQTGDDLLGLFGESATTGKSNFTDIAQGKKTLPIWLSYHHANQADRSLLKEYVGNKNITLKQAETVRAIITRSGGLEICQQLMSDYRETCLDLLSTIAMPDDLRRFLRGFVAHLEKREA